MTTDLTTQFGDLTLKSPIVIGACPMTAHDLTRIALVSSGAGAIVLPSLFDEQVIRWNRNHGVSQTSSRQQDKRLMKRAAAMQLESDCDAESYLDLVSRASKSTTIPVIASLNGRGGGEWLDFAVQLQSAGAAAIELNILQEPINEYSDPRAVENGIVDAASRVRKATDIPLFLKLGGHYTSLVHLARRLLSKAQGLVLFGHAPEFDISLENFQIVSRWGLTEPGSVARSIESIMRVHAHCPDMPLAASGGIGDSSDMAKVLLAGADVAMVTSAVYRDGPDVIGSLIDGLTVFLDRNGIGSLQELKTRRPTLLSADENRLVYVRALSRNPDPQQLRSADRTLECDRWGHIRTQN